MEEYKRKLKVFSLKKINYLSMILFLIMFIIGMAVNLFALKEKTYTATGYVWADMILGLGLLAIGVITHEFLHGMSALIFGKCGGENLCFGFKPKELLFFCNCKKPITINSYRIMLVTPLIITGLIPYIICMFFGGLILIAVFSVLIAGAAGDIVMLCGLAKEKNGKQLVLDHSNAVGYYLLYKTDELPEGFEETTEEDEKRIFDDEERKEQERTKKGVLLKTFIIGLFISLAVLALFLIALLMKVL